MFVKHGAGRYDYRGIRNNSIIRVVLRNSLVHDYTQRTRRGSDLQRAQRLGEELADHGVYVRVEKRLIQTQITKAVTSFIDITGKRLI
jgi:hypothetical protein